jgi:DNA-binding MarR family transcriptional regulator
MGHMTAPGDCNATALRKAARRLTQLYDDAFAACGLRATQYAILSELGRRGEGPPTMGELAHALVLDRSALGHALRPLERDGLIALDADDDDARRRHVVLTRAGQAKLRAARARWELAQAHFEARFGAERARELRSMLLELAADERLAALEA